MSAERVSVLVNGRICEVEAGLPLALLLSAEDPVLRRSPREAAPRGLFCGMGLCFECMVEVNGLRRRSCLTPAEEGMVIRTDAAALKGDLS